MPKGANDESRSNQKTFSHIRQHAVGRHNAFLSDIDVLTEKPMTTDEDKCQAILDAERRSKKKVIVGLNYRWSPYMTKIKQLISEGTIGNLVSVDFNWILNACHGASYFRRWHGLRQYGGTLWVHKAEMDQEGNEKLWYQPVIFHKIWNEYETIVVGHKRGGHGGGDDRLHNKLFYDPTEPEPYKHPAGTRDGAMSILIGIAARKSIESGKPVRIAELTDLEPRKQRI